MELLIYVALYEILQLYYSLVPYSVAYEQFGDYSNSGTCPVTPPSLKAMQWRETSSTSASLLSKPLSTISKVCCGFYLALCNLWVNHEINLFLNSGYTTYVCFITFFNTKLNIRSIAAPCITYMPVKTFGYIQYYSPMVNFPYTKQRASYWFKLS